MLLILFVVTSCSLPAEYSNKLLGEGVDLEIARQRVLVAHYQKFVEFLQRGVAYKRI